MAHRQLRLPVVLVLFLGSVITATPANGQAWNYPSFQFPQIDPRIFSFAIGSGGEYGTTLFGKWQEGVSQKLGVSAELGFADPDFTEDTRVFLGGGLAYQVLQSTVDLPLDIALTGGAYLSFGDEVTIFRLPFGATLGHRFPLERRLAITPYVHPRISVDLCSSDDCGEDDSAFLLNFDLGTELEFTPQLAGRVGLVFGDVLDINSEVGFALGLAWRPPGLGIR
jgi:hypothetical protein